jgi:hypothetical protein
LSNLSKTKSVARMAIIPGIPIPSAMPRVSLERPFNGADDGVDENVGNCMVDVGSGLSEWLWGTEMSVVCGVFCEDNVADDMTDEDAAISVTASTMVEVQDAAVFVADAATCIAVRMIVAMVEDAAVFVATSTKGPPDVASTASRYHG